MSTFDICNNSMEVHQNYAEPWKVTVVDTGVDTMTGGRLLRVRKYLGRRALLPDLRRRRQRHRHQRAHRDFTSRTGGYATVTAIQPPGRFGALEFDGDSVSRFVEKPRGDGRWINGGFFIL